VERNGSKEARGFRNKNEFRSEGAHQRKGVSEGTARKEVWKIEGKKKNRLNVHNDVDHQPVIRVPFRKAPEGRV